MGLFFFLIALVNKAARCLAVRGFLKYLERVDMLIK